jgi:hypothetical protein
LIKNPKLYFESVVECLFDLSGANPTIASYNASVVKTYNAMSSLVRFENKNDFFYFEKTLWLTTTLPL